MESDSFMRKNCVILLLIFIIFSAVSISQEQKTPVEVLKACGISPEPQNLVNFIQSGSLNDINLDILADNNIPSSQLIISAMQILADEQFEPAVPVLIKIVKGEYTPAARRFIDYDCSIVPRSSQAEKKEVIEKYLRFNALNALGVIGDPAALPVMKEVFDNSEPGLFKINAALGMASLGFGDGVEYLVDQISEDNRILASEAASALSFIMGQELDYKANTPIIRRERTIEKVEEWWEENEGIYRPFGKEIIQRRLNEPEPSPPMLRSLRDLLSAAANYADFTNRGMSMEARERLSALGPSVLPQLKAFALDKEEDINVRMEALRRISRMASTNEALDILKKAKKDDNPEIEKLAKTIIDQIKRRED